MVLILALTGCLPFPEILKRSGMCTIDDAITMIPKNGIDASQI
jgi:hypothetical protein